ncbi:unnamed protein product, partial [Laminaria digitata]
MCLASFHLGSVPGGTDFVYERDHDAFAKLDDFCNWNQMSEPAAPLIVSGPSGSGKSALLANWLLHFRRRLEQRPKLGGPLEEPFIFSHAVGCTRHGVDVDQLLWRLLADVKQRFDLARNVPNEAERLSWELPRFLDLAARKGRLVIVIDGLHRLQDKNGAETGLQWLPLRVPGNVRLIVTATHPDPNYLQLHEQKIRQHMMASPHHQGLTSQSSRASSCGGDGGETNTATTTTTTTTQFDCMGAKIRENVDAKEDGEAEYESSHRRRKVVLMELSRRKWPTLDIGPLETWRKRDILEAFLKRSLSGRSTGEPPPPLENDGSNPQTQQQQQQQQQQGSGTFLTGVDVTDDRGITFAADSDTGRVGLGGDGGLVLFPSMVESILLSEATSSVLYLRTLLRALDWAATNQYDVRALLEKMLTTAKNVGALYNVFFDSIESGNHPTEASVQRAQQASEADGGSRALQDAIDALANTGCDDDLGVGVGVAVEPQDACFRQQQQQQQHHDAALGRVDQGADGEDAAAASDSEGHDGDGKKRQEQGEQDIEGRVESGQKEEGGEEEEEEGGNEEEEEYSEDNYDDEFDADEFEDKEGAKLAKNQEKESGAGGGSDAALQEGGSGNVGNGEREDNASNRPATASFDPTPEETNDLCAPSTLSGDGGRASGTCCGGIGDVPVYLSGGSESESAVSVAARVRRMHRRPLTPRTVFLSFYQVEGFGVTIGRAFALLHVVRHGLRSQELWTLLAALKASTSAHEKAEGTEGEAESLLLRKLLKNQNRLIDSIRLMDVDRDGVISTAEFRAAIVAMDVGLTERQVEKLIRSIDVDGDGDLDMQ